ncbi:MAG: type IV pilus modification PilV family protein [Candidatus Sumerlaeaceae bacterium]|jgi:type II secretion system protein I
MSCQAHPSCEGLRREVTLRRRGWKRGNDGFLLLEVIVSLVILGIAVATIMRSFTVSMNAIRRIDITTQACVLAERFMQDLELEPGKARSGRGTFEEEGYPDFSWELTVQDEEVRYKNLQTKVKTRDLRSVRHALLIISYQNATMRSPTQVLELHLYLPPIERFRFDSKFYNELFREEERGR